jgi:hypothetical protein
MSSRNLLAFIKPRNSLTLGAVRVTAPTRSGADQPFVIGMGSNPEPIISVPFKNSQGAIVVSDACAPDFTDFLETNRGVPRVTFPKSVILSRHFPNLWRDLGVRLPESRNRDRFRRAAWFFLRRFRHRLPQAENPSAQRLRLLRSGDPTPHCGAPATDEPARKTPLEKVEQPSLRSLPESSQTNISFNGVSPAKRFQWGRTQSLERGNFSSNRSGLTQPILQWSCKADAALNAQYNDRQMERIYPLLTYPSYKAMLARRDIQCECPLHGAP